MAELSEIIGAAAGFVQRVNNSRLRYGFIGIRQNDGSYAQVRSNRRKMVNVTMQDGTITEAICTTVQPKAGKPIVLEERNGRLVVVSSQIFDATHMLGDYSESPDVGEHWHRRGSGLEYIAEPELFAPGLVYPDGAGALVLNVVGISYYNDGDKAVLNDTTLDVSSSVPADDGMRVPVLVGINRDTNTVAVTLGNAVVHALEPAFTRADYGAISTSLIPLMGFPLLAGQTTFTDYRTFVDMRHWLTYALKRFYSTVVAGAYSYPQREAIRFAGDITIADDAGADQTVVTITGGGSGGSADGDFWEPNAAPVSPNAADDEFADNSGGLPTGWTEFDQNATLTVSENEYGVSLVQGSQGSLDIVGIYKSLAAGAFTIETALSLYGDTTGSSQFCFGALTLWEDATDATGDIFQFRYGLNESNIPQILLIRWTQFDGTATLIGSGITGNILTSAPNIVLRLRRDGSNNFNAQFSRTGDGMWLMPQGSFTLPFTPSHAGISMFNLGTGVDARLVSRFWRYQASDVGLTSVLSGDRVDYFAN